MTEVKVPAVAESITEVTLSRWLVADGSYVHIDQPICELETDKASQEIPAPVSGKVTFVAKEGQDIKVGGLLCTLDEKAEKPAESTATVSAATEMPKTPAPAQSAASQPAPAAPATTPSHASGHPSPAAHKIMQENNLKGSDIQGTGIGGRITREDAVRAAKERAKLPIRESFSRSERMEKMSRLRKTIAERLVYSKNSTAMLTTFNEVDMTEINRLREKHGDTFKKKHEVSLGMMSFFTKAVCLALEKYPAVNAYIDEGNIVYHDYCDISIAVSTPKGLVVPVIRNAESLSMAGIEKKIKELAIKGRDGNLSMDEMTGGTFTISNGGVFGSLMSTPIINPPQSAILGMHKVQERPMVIQGKIEIRPMMYVALSYDHRIIDGKESVGFLVTVKDYLENPHKLLLGADPTDLLLDI